MTTSQLSLEANYLALRAIGPWLHSLIGDRPECGGIELAVHELATNSVDHAQASDGMVLLEGWMDGESLVVEMRDRGIDFDQSSVASPDPDVPQVRGYGLMILEQLAEDVRYQHVNDVNHWVVRFALTNDDEMTTHGMKEAGR